MWANLQVERHKREVNPAEGTEIVAITGASAGNVNALIAASERARPIDIGRDETTSLLWQAWTQADWLLKRGKRSGVIDAQAVWFYCTIALGMALPVWRERRELGMPQVVASVNDVAALLRLIRLR